MAGAWAPPTEMTLLTGTIGAIVEWRKSDNDAALCRLSNENVGSRCCRNLNSVWFAP